MTEQFSPECIEYLLSDDVLQRLWVPGAGDWAWNREISAMHLLRDEFDKCETDVWLPTLYQLLQVIEGAGKRVELILYELDRGTYYGGLAELMMRAAKLAVKAVKAVEEKR